MAKLAETPRHWRFLLHGGCTETCPDPDQQRNISQNLQAVACKVRDALMRGDRAKDAVVLAVSALEDWPVFNAGRGAALTRDGIHQLEAGIADGNSARYGAVGCTEATKNPILVANALMDHGPHTMLVGRAADETTKKLGFDVVANNYFTTPFRKAYWDQTSRLGQRDAGSEMGTVGAIVLDSYGHLAAGGSTGGPTGKIDGRIGDTAILGAGLYADARLGVVCGEGDQIFKQLVAANVAKYHALGSSLSDAARQALRHISATGASCALAATCLYPTTFPVLPSHEFYKDDQLLIGHSRYPTTLGHTLAIVESGADLFSLQPAEFVDALTKISTTA